MADLPQLRLLVARTPASLAAARSIIQEYAGGLGIDLCFQQLDTELASLPGDYAEPNGALLLAYADSELAGCGAIRPVAGSDYANACEMKRLYVRPAFRRLGLGRALAQDLVDRAVAAGYSAILLDTLDEMETARNLYGSLGFEAIPPYYFNPIPGAHYLKRSLAPAAARSRSGRYASQRRGRADTIAACSSRIAANDRKSCP